MLTHRAGVVGSPITHSLSPVLHRSAYAALGLDGWSYDRAEVAAGQLARHVCGLGPEWAGLSVTMPGKEEALALASTASEEALLAGAANTLLRRGVDWYADNTDVPGLAAALAEAGAGAPRSAVVVGGGATARSALLALRRLGVADVTFLVRDGLRPRTRQLLDRLAGTGSAPDVRVRALADGIPLEAGVADVVVATLPTGAPAPAVQEPGATAALPVVLDVTYAPWPTPLAAAVRAASGGRVQTVRGTTMLLHQAARQVELMTGLQPPLAAMREALAAAVDGTTGAGAGGAGAG